VTSLQITEKVVDRDSDHCPHCVKISIRSCLLPERSERKFWQKSEQDAQLSQRDRAAGCVIVFATSRRLELGDNVLRTL